MAHNGPIRSLIQLKDHNLASGSDDKTIKILDLSSMWFCMTFTEHKGSVKALAQLLDEGWCQEVLIKQLRYGI